MRTPPTNWTTLMAQPHETETRIDIAGVSYYGYDGNSGIWSCETRPMLFDKLSVGNCCSAQINLTLCTKLLNYIWDCHYVYDLGFIANFSGTWDEFYNKYHSGIGNVEIGTKLNGEYGAPIVEDYSLVTTAEEAKAAMLEGKTFVAGWEDIDEFEERWIILQSLDLVDGEWRVSAKAYGYDYEATDRIYFRGVWAGEEVSSQDRNAYPDDGYTVEHPEPFSDYWYVYEREEEIHIPQMAKMELYVRLTNGALTTDWVRKGIYYIDTREWDAQHEFLTITGYDAMLKTEQNYFTPPVTITGWPKLDKMVVAEICDRIGVELDEYTFLTKGYMVQLPAVSSDGSDSDTLREVLGWIGAAYCGNWIISDDGYLKLVPLVTNNYADVGTDAIDLSRTPAYEAIGTVHLVVSEDAQYVAGTGGRVFEVSCPWGTQEMANNILINVRGYEYQPLSITTATNANPLWELGDRVRVNGYTSVIASMPTTFGLKYTVDIEAPESEEINHEYPYQDKGTRNIERKIAQSSASLRVDIEGVIARVQSAEGNISSLGIEVGQIAARVSAAEGSISSLSIAVGRVDARVESAEGDISNLSLAVGQISSEVSGKITTYRQVLTPVTSTIGDLWYCTMPNYPYEQDTWYRWNGSEWEKSSEVVDIPVAPEWELGLNYYKGNVVDIDGRWYIAKSDHTATSANKPPNSTYWDYQPSISSISRSQINQTMSEIELAVNESSLRLWGGGVDIVAPTANLKVNAANITGTLTVGWSNVSDKPTFSNVATSGSYSDLSNKPSIPSEYDITTIVGNTVTTGYVNALGITAKYVSADAVLANGIQLSGLLDVYSGRTQYGYLGGSNNFDSAGVVLTSPNANNFCVATNDACKISYGNVHNIFTYSTGCYSSSQMQIGSDRRLKDNIEYDVDRFDGVFDALKPCSFVYKNDADRTHFGLIAQEVTQSIDASELPWDNLALIGHLSLDDTYSVAYGELIAVCIAQIQKLKARVTSLEATS